MDPLQGLDWGAAYWVGTQRKRGIAAVDAILSAIANLGDEVWLAIIALGILIWLRAFRGKLAAAVYLVSILLALGAIFGIQALVHRPQPVGAERTDNVPLSFPSESAFLSSLVFTVLALLVAGNFARPRSRIVIYSIFAVLIMSIGASHMYWDQHFLTDMLAGWAGGLMLALAGDRIAGYSCPKRGISPGIGGAQPAK